MTQRKDQVLQAEKIHTPHPQFLKITYLHGKSKALFLKVFVSINYRLGPMGWFAHPALRSGDAIDDSGNPNGQGLTEWKKAPRRMVLDSE
jgi:hypothetical protein